MKALFGALFGLTMMASAAHAGPVYDVCEKQIREYVATELGTSVTSLSFEWRNRASAGGRAWVRTPKCSGMYVFELRAGQAECTGPHYGRIPNYISTVWGYGACSDALSADVNPNESEN